MDAYAVGPVFALPRRFAPGTTRSLARQEQADSCLRGRFVSSTFLQVRGGELDSTRPGGVSRAFTVAILRFSARGEVMSSLARKRLAFAVSLCLVLLSMPARGLESESPQPQPAQAIPVYPPSQTQWTGPAVDGSQPLPGALQPTRYTTIYPGSAVGQPVPTDMGPAAPVPRFHFGPTPEVGLLDNFMFFAGLDGAKGPEDLGINANLGSRIGINWGIPLCQELGLGLQIGAAENFQENAIRVLKPIDGTTQRFQTWVTLGLFQRSDCGFNWGAVYDFRFDDYYRNLTTAQVRMQVGYNFTSSDELGMWGSVRTRDDGVQFEGFDLQIRPMDQGAIFWRHVWANNAVTRIWVGMADSHGRFVLTSPGTPPINNPVLFGADVFIPLTDCIALWGEANFVTPNDTGTVTAFLGLAFTPGTANLFGRSRFAPYLPTANNPSFSLDAR
jgi:hypothetical protein